MRAVVISAERHLVATDIPDPQMVDGAVMVRVIRCGICGSDLHARSNERYPAGCVLGHEIVGEIVETAPGVEDWEAGQRVALYHAVACGECTMCKAGNTHMCLDALGTSLGLGAVQGGYAEFIVVPTAVLHTIPDRLSYDHAALAEPLSIAMHGVNKAHVEPDDRVCILGAGPIGAMAACALRVQGVSRIVVVDPNERRRAKMIEMGFSVVDLDGVHEAVTAALGDKPDVVLECSGHVTATGLAVELAAYQGRVVLQGVPREPISLSQFAVVQKEVDIVGAASCTPVEFAAALGDLATGRIPADDLITGVIPFDRAEATFDALLTGGNAHIKVLLDPTLS